MTTKRSIVAVLGVCVALSLLFLNISCGSSGGRTSVSSSTTPTNTNADDSDAGLTDAQEAYYETLPAIPVPDRSTIVLADGSTLAEADAKFGTSVPTRQTTTLSPQQYKDQYIQKLVEQATDLTIHTPEKFPAGTDLTQPAQDGYAYVYGSRQISNRSSGGCCPESLYGLDCSGLIIVCSNFAGIPLAASNYTGSLVKANSWPVPKQWQLSMQSIAPSKLDNNQTGDIICWSDHIGIVYVNAAGQAFVIQSEGNTSCTIGAAQCTKNKDANHGPRKITLAQATSKVFFGTPVSYLRLTPAASTSPGNYTGTYTIISPSRPGTYAISLEFNHDSSTTNGIMTLQTIPGESAVTNVFLSGDAVSNDFFFLTSSATLDNISGTLSSDESTIEGQILDVTNGLQYSYKVQRN